MPDPTLNYQSVSPLPPATPRNAVMLLWLSWILLSLAFGGMIAIHTFIPHSTKGHPSPAYAAISGVGPLVNLVGAALAGPAAIFKNRWALAVVLANLVMTFCWPM